MRTTSLQVLKYALLPLTIPFVTFIILISLIASAAINYGYLLVFIVLPFYWGIRLLGENIFGFALGLGLSILAHFAYRRLHGIESVLDEFEKMSNRMELICDDIWERLVQVFPKTGPKNTWFTTQTVKDNPDKRHKPRSERKNLEPPQNILHENKIESPASSKKVLFCSSEEGWWGRALKAAEQKELVVNGIRSAVKHPPTYSDNRNQRQDQKPSPPLPNPVRPLNPLFCEPALSPALEVRRSAIPETNVVLLHRQMQNEIYDCLERVMIPGREVRVELGGIDILVDDPGISTIIEIKTGDHIIVAIREAMGQLLEYRYFRRMYIPYEDPRLLIVSPHKLTPEASDYIRHLQEACRLKIGYAQYVPGSYFFSLEAVDW